MAYKLAGFIAELIHYEERPKAYCIRIDGRRIYLPKSQVKKKERVDGNNYRFVIPLWLAEQKKIENVYVG